MLVAGTEADSRQAELYDPRAGTWTATPAMAQERYGEPATLLSDGRVLIVGSVNGAGAELYDPGTGSWTVAGNMTIPRHGHTATLLPDGTVLVVGGDGRSAEIFDPGSN